MTAHTSPRMLLLWAIRLYQQHLSPRKGYGCAYRLHHGRGSGCSGVGLRAIRRHGIFRGVRILKARLQRCSEVSRSQRSKPSAHRIAASQRGDCDPGCDAGDCLDLGDCYSNDSRRRNRRKVHWLFWVIGLLLIAALCMVAYQWFW